MSDRLIQFEGRECQHCKEMAPLVTKLEKELDIKITKVEVWHNAKNATWLEKTDKIGCGGVPFFFNEKTGKAICGAVPYDKLKAWALGK